MKDFIGAGILPYAIREDNELVFLLGLENSKIDKNRLYSDFGGGREEKETPSATAYREFI